VTATPSTGYRLENWTLGGILESASPSYTFTIGSNEMLVANFVTSARPVLSIARSNGVTFLSWTNLGAGFALESTTNLNPAAWAVVTNATNISGGIFTVSNAWPDQTRFFQLISQ
jgi:hypothetical protein